MSPTAKIESVAGFLEHLKATKNTATWYRGQRDTSWRLNPSLFRGSGASLSELSYVRRFQQHAISFLNVRPSHEWEWLFLMQHHAVPTRLLDWSENPLVALYFATASNKGRGTPGAVWCLQPKRLNELSGYPVNGIDIPAFGVDDQVLKPYLPSGVNEPPADRKPLAILAQRQFPRLVAQQGVFTIFHKSKVCLDELEGHADWCTKLEVPAGKKKKIRSELARLGLDELSLFPELERVAGRIRESIGGRAK